MLVDLDVTCALSALAYDPTSAGVGDCGVAAIGPAHRFAAIAMETKTRLLFCINDRGEGKRSCGASGANALRKYAKEKAADMPHLKVKKSGCLGHCKHGPVVQILPEKALYRCKDMVDVDQLFAQRIAEGETATALLIDLPKKSRKK